MILNLDTYHPKTIPYKNGLYCTFLLYMNNARDIILADIATGLTESNNQFIYQSYLWKCSGCDKFFVEETGEWYARIIGAERVRKIF